MKSIILLVLIYCSISSCVKHQEKIKPEESSISESIYASGILKSKDQYQVFSTVTGIISDILVKEGDTILKNQPIITISSEAQKLNKENAELTAQFSDLKTNEGKLNEAIAFTELAKNKMTNDSLLLSRQKSLWAQNVGSKIELEQRELAYQNSKTTYYSTIVKYQDLKRQLNLSASQSLKNYKISSKIESDYTIKSEINGTVYEIFKSKGEIINPQTPLAIIGDANKFTLEMQVDEYDIFKISPGMEVIVSLDSYRGNTFEAKVTKVYPIMNERNKTFLIQAEFVNAPPKLFPNISFEANIILETKKNAILIPRNFLLNDSTVILSNGDKKNIKTGLKNYQLIEIISGLSLKDEIIKPNE